MWDSSQGCNEGIWNDTIKKYLSFCGPSLYIYHAMIVFVIKKNKKDKI